jgi:molecular chaperone DnaK
MSDEAVSYFGIDLGTTYSAIAYIDETGRPTVVRDQQSSAEVTPSVVYFEGPSNVVVGKTAKEVSRVYPERVVSLVKRHMGQESEWEFDGNDYTPESISALILKQLAQDAAVYTGAPVKTVVITVPAYFGMLERDATRNAGTIAGLNVIGIVPEPVAAALHYDALGDEERTILVFDLGGGTFDTTVIRVGGDDIEVICTDGDQKLGGADWDARLLDHLLESFVAKASPEGSPSDDEQFMQELALTVEDTKRQLSQVETRPVALRFGGASAIVEVTRAAFEERTTDLVDRTIEYTERTLRTFAEKRPGTTIDEVLLVGGSTKMPMITARLRAKFGWEPKLYDPDLAVAKGAARYALGRAVWNWDPASAAVGEPSTAEVTERIEEIAASTGISARAIRSAATKRITNVLPKAFGVKLVDTERPGWSDDPEGASFIRHLVHANDQLPSGPHELSASTVFDNQTEIPVAVYEQAGSEESQDLTANKAVDNGAGVISGLPPLPADSPLLIVMSVDDEGLLTVRAEEASTGKDLVIQVQVSVLSEQDVRDAKRQVSAITVKG